jgi:hypothetical protein
MWVSKGRGGEWGKLTLDGDNVVRCHCQIVFAGSVLWTEKIHRTELNRTAVRSFFRLRLEVLAVPPLFLQESGHSGGMEFGREAC